MSPTVGIIISLIFFLIGVIIVCDIYRRAKQLAPVLRKLQEVDAELIAKTKERDILSANLEEMRTAKINALRTIDDAEAVKKWLEEHEPRMLSLKNEEERLKREVGNAVKDYEYKKEQIEELNAKIENLGNLLTNSQKELVVNEEKTLRAKLEYERLTEETRKLKARIEPLECQITKLLGQKDELLAEVADLNQRKAERDSLLNEIKRLKQDVTTLNEKKLNIANEVDSLTSTQTRLSNDIARMQGQLPSEKTYWQELEMPFIQTKKTRKPLKDKSETKWLEDFSNTLTMHGFHFNDRIIKAFHTGLKCGEVTPLVVLAGISGTGKSLLPELYSAYAGFHFLSVPVQPRWDSPQDMLGFCNYMEGRYKATELARLLWQMRNDKDMLSIVLLDEMNLARVEYYFSDLLSKLEMRRGLDTSNQELMEKASITLEGFQKGPRHLYIDTNVFFIGTMNEDETTQMLSDKVVDRSNLLRFGQPRELGVAPNKKSFIEATKKCGYLNQECWTTWAASQNNELETWFTKVQEINNQFALIHRPFAHRVDQAIRKYMTQYPYNPTYSTRNSREREYKIAFADQIEMKILPKLNGVELAAPHFNEVKDYLTTVLNTLDDDALIAAFNQATDESTNTFFKWKGVMR